MGKLINKSYSKYASLPIQIKAAVWFLICSFLQKGISMISTPIFTRLMDTTQYGQYSVFLSWFDILAVFVTMHLYNGMYPVGLVKFKEDAPAFSSSLQGLALTLTVIWVVVYLLFHGFWNHLLGMSGIQMLAMLVMIWTTTIFGLWATEKRVTLQYRSLILVTILVSVAKPLLGILFVLSAEDKATARILAIVLVEIFVYIWLFVAQMRRGKVFVSKKYWKYMLSMHIPLIPHYLAGTVLSGADRIMIRNMVSESAAGIYSLAYSVSSVMIMFNSALQQTIGPWIYKKIQKERIGDISGVAYISLIMVAGLNIMLIAFAPEIIAVFAPSAYYDAIWVIPPVAMSVYFIYAYNLYSQFEFYFEQRKMIVISTGAAAMLNVLLNAIFIHIFGYYAAGYTTLVCYIVYASLHYIFSRKICMMHFSGNKVYNTGVIMAISMAFLTCGFAFLFSYNMTWLRYLLIVALIVIMLFKRKNIIMSVGQIMHLRNGNGGEI